VIGRWTTRVMVAAATLTLLAAACGSSSSPSSGSSPAGTGSSASAGTIGTSSGGGTTTTSGGSGGTSTDTILEVNYAFNPSKPSVKSGSAVMIKNTTTDTPHNFTVTGQNIDVTLQPGKSAKVKIDLPPGTYPFFCSFHQSLGMTGTLTVK
jgi:plastocyanin